MMTVIGNTIAFLAGATLAGGMFVAAMAAMECLTDHSDTFKRIIDGI